MKNIFQNQKLSIWALALGYFAFYVPYSSMTKVLSKGLLFDNSDVGTGYEILPMVLLGTAIGFSFLLFVTGWWKDAGKISLFGIKIPFATNKYTLLSGLATAVIIATTTLAYSFTGISIVFAALLMRGGVLLMAPFIDLAYRRKIQWYSWLAFGLTFFSLLLIFSEKAGFMLIPAATINIIAYLSGYFFRLQLMTYTAKSEDPYSNQKYFVEEMLSAMFFILVIPIILALISYGDFMTSLALGYTKVLFSQLLLPTLIIGFLYACLYIFGSRIYLNKRENTFCIPVNRSASLLAGMTAAVLISIFFEGTFYTVTQLWSGFILLLAILSLSIPSYLNRSRSDTQSFVYLFICPGNTGRSPMAQTICSNKIKSRLEQLGKLGSSDNYIVLSAGIKATEGLTMSQDAVAALEHLEMEVSDHSSVLLAEKHIELADKIFCMSTEHRSRVLQKFPAASDKVIALDYLEEIPNPHNLGKVAYIECAKKLDNTIDDLILKNEILIS